MPRTYDFLPYGTEVGTIAVGRPDGYADRPGRGGPALGFAIADPDFNLKSLRVNLVARWEFRPGSTLYLVWTQRRQDAGVSGDFSLRP